MSDPSPILPQHPSGEGLAGALSEFLDPDQISLEKADLDTHSTDKWFASAPPDVVVFARSTSDVSALLAFCNEHRVPVTPRAGVGYVGGCVPLHGGVALSLAKMDRILDVSASDGVAVVQPGVITGDLQDAARAVGMSYPPDPASLKECSIGGNIATNAGGPRCVKYGVTRHYVLGLEVVLASGEVLRTGGRCHKNKQGFDLVSPFVGSEGMLGVVTEATLRLVPDPPQRAMLSTGFAEFSQAAAAVEKILTSGFLPSALEITDEFTLRAARAYTGSDAIDPEAKAHLLVEVDGRPGAVKAEVEELSALLQEGGALRMEIADTPEGCDRIWGLRREFSYSLRATGLTKLNEDVVVPRGKLVELVEFAHQLQEDTGIAVASFGHAGDGNIHVNLMVDDYEKPEVAEKADAALDRLFQQIMAWGGAITGEHGVGMAKSRWFDQAMGETGVRVHQSLKDALDPRGILNPGKFLQ